MTARPDASLDAALDRHVTSRTYRQYALRRPAAPSLVQKRPSRTLILKDLLGAYLGRDGRAGMPGYALRSIAPLVLVAAFAPTPAHSLLHSRELWATVDVCNPKDQPNTIGIRGSMPGDGHTKDVMYIRFRVQYLDATTKTWLNLGKGGDSGPLKLGSGALARQGGFSVELAPVAGKPAFTLRGYVLFQWRRGATVIQSATRLTTSGHTSLAGADPRGFSAATCKLA